MLFCIDIIVVGEKSLMKGPETGALGV